jgi:PAS domain S-box-containing protein
LELDFQHITHPDDLSADLELFARLLRGELSRYRLGKRYVRKDGSVVDVILHVSLVRTERGEPSHCISQIEDVTALKRYEAERERYFQVSIDLLAIASTDGHYRRVNPAWTDNLGWSEPELLARPIIDFVHPEDREAMLLAAATLNDGTSIMNLENRHQHKDGSYRLLQWRAVFSRQDGLIYASACNITGRKELQTRLLLSDRMASVGTLAAGVAHEVNNPLSYVISNLELALESLPRMGSEPGYELQELLLSAREGAERVRKIVRGLHAYSRAGEEQKKFIALAPILDNALAMVESQLRHRARVVKNYGPTPTVHADESRLSQVFINLLVNAAQSLPEGQADRHEVSIGTGLDMSGRARVEISDTGPGIPEALLPRVFDPFFTTKPIGEGTGLGLFICHSIVSEIGGEISVSSVPGRTTFRVLFDAAAPAQRGAIIQTAGAPPSAAMRRGRILIVDDEPRVRVVLSRALSPEHHVEAVAHGRDALERIRAGKRFDVILCDLMMPIVTGVEVYECLLKEAPGQAARMIFMSGSAPSPKLAQFFADAGNPHLEKPFETAALRSLVRRVLDAGGDPAPATSALT